MTVSKVDKLKFRLETQGFLGLACAVVIKFGRLIQDFGLAVEKKIKERRLSFSMTRTRSLPGGLGLIQLSYAGMEESSMATRASLPREDGDVICWIVPPFSKGSGGHTTIFRFISGLEKLGVKNKVFLLNDMSAKLSADIVKSEICRFFSPIAADVEILLPERMERQVNTLVCTSWQTAYAARAMNANRKIYFMQDYEPYFNPVGSYYYFAEETYRFGFEYFTAGPWLLDKVKRDFSGKGDFFYLCPEQEIYFPRTEFTLPQLVAARADPEKKRVFSIGLYNRVHTPRRCVELVWVALNILSRKGHSIEVLTFGDDQNQHFPFPNKSLGILGHNHLAEVYSFCDIVIAPSATNLSLLAREVMACGGVVVDLEGENTRSELFDGANSVLCQPTVDSFVNRLESLILHPNELAELKQKVRDGISDMPDWKDQFKHMKNFLETNSNAM